MEHPVWLKNSVSLFGHNWRENADMSNVERSYNASRRMKKGCIEMLNSYVLKRPLKYSANA